MVSGEPLKGATLKRRRDMLSCPFLEQKYTSHPQGLLGNKTPQLYMFTERELLCNCCLRGTSVSNKRLARWKTMRTWGCPGLVPKFVTEIQEHKGPFDQIGVMK
jgi:hypothetical protein